LVTVPVTVSIGIIAWIDVKYAEAFGRYRQFVKSQEDAFMDRFEKDKIKLLKDDP
jgi:hypothetical protein